jgi:hypothetical protein
MRFEDMPKMRIEDMRRMEDMMPRLRERMQELPMHVRELDMAPMRMRLKEDGMWRTLEPSRVRVTSPNGRFYIDRDSAGTLRRSKVLSEKTKAEKEALEKTKKEDEKKK